MITVQFTSFEGHGKKEWDPNIPGQLEEMRQWFKNKLKAGFRAFALNEGDEAGKLITDFDEEAERIILVADKIKMVPPARGG